MGFELYQQLLDTAISSLKQGKVFSIDDPLPVGIEISLNSPALLPKDYCDDINIRLDLYRRLSRCHDWETLQRLKEEIIDRFGLMPLATKTLIEIQRLRITAQSLGIQKIRSTAKFIYLDFQLKSMIDNEQVIGLIQKQRKVTLSGQHGLRIEHQLDDPIEKSKMIVELLKKIIKREETKNILQDLV